MTTPANIKHTILLTGDHEGTLEWTCPECGRVVLGDDAGLRVIVKGDQLAQHSGSAGGLQFRGLEITQ